MGEQRANQAVGSVFGDDQAQFRRSIKTWHNESGLSIFLTVKGNEWANAPVWVGGDLLAWPLLRQESHSTQAGHVVRRSGGIEAIWNFPSDKRSNSAAAMTRLRHRLQEQENQILGGAPILGEGLLEQVAFFPSTGKGCKPVA